MTFGAICGQLLPWYRRLLQRYTMLCRLETMTIHQNLWCGSSVSIHKRPTSILWLQFTRGIYVTPVCCNKQTRKRRPITVNKKAMFRKQEICVKVHKGITVEEFAKKLNVDEEYVKAYWQKATGGHNYQLFKRRFRKESSLVLMQSIGKSLGVMVKLVDMPTGLGGEQWEEEEEEDKDIYPEPAPDPSVLVSRPPVVTIMGHVDHGKTSLLDYLRNTNVVDQEFGGITQHIGAFSVRLPTGEPITFLDTPGHAAFAAMRERGANVTDIVILVVAADDGVMEQTVQSIQYALSAGVPIIVAINKIDKPGINIKRTMEVLCEHGIVTESLGGNVQCVSVSALKGTNMLQLQEAIVTQAELMELQADPVGKVRGRVIEASTDVGRGKLVTAVVERGTMRYGQLLIAGTGWGKVRQMFDENGKLVKAATPGTAVEIIGWRQLPSAGSDILEASSETEIRNALSWREKQMQRAKNNDRFDVMQKERAESQAARQEKLRELHKKGHMKIRTAKTKESAEVDTSPRLGVVIKGDVDGSVEAILDCLGTYSSDQCRLDVLHHGIGDVTTTDVETAEIFNGEIYAFNVKIPDKIVRLCDSKRVCIKQHNVIYNMMDDVRDTMLSRIPKPEVEDTIGEATVKQTFEIQEGKEKVTVVGCRCINGFLQASAAFKVVRDGQAVYRGRAVSLKHFKEEVDVIEKDMECGIRLSHNDVEILPGDSIVCYELREVQPVLQWDPGF